MVEALQCLMQFGQFLLNFHRYVIFLTLLSHITSVLFVIFIILFLLEYVCKKILSSRTCMNAFSLALRSLSGKQYFRCFDYACNAITQICC